MRRIYRILIVLCLLAALTASMIPTGLAVTTGEIQKEIDRLQDEADKIDEQREKLAESLEQTNAEARTYAEKKENLDHEIMLCMQEMDNLNAQIHQFNLLISESQASLDDLQVELSDLFAHYRLRMRALQERGELNVWSVILASNSFSEMLSRRVMIEEVAHADQSMIEDLRKKSDEILSAKDVLAEQKAGLELKKARQEELQSDLDAKREEADQILAELNKNKEALKAEMQKAAEEKERLSEEIAKREAEYTKLLEEQRKQDGTPLPPTESGFAFPVAPSGFQIMTSPYGYRSDPFTGETRFHNGLDLAAYSGTNIYASKSGTVTTASYSYYGYGNHVVINHGDGFSTLYGHMTSYVVSEGDYVTQGQLIGYVGSTGNSTGPHLHFTIYYNGTTVNPLGYVALP